jgi:hypothetical protein
MEVYYELEKKNKSIALMCAHYASYEWVVSMNYYINCKGFGIYKKLANPHFDKLVKRIRSKFKAELITTKETIPTITENYKKQCNESLWICKRPISSTKFSPSLGFVYGACCSCSYGSRNAGETFRYECDFF